MTFTTTATFRAVDNHAISPSGEVVELLGHDLNEFFDLLVEVEWLSGPRAGESGWLLCSHYCRWPAELVNEADFIEGCFTPNEYREDPRLALGYHGGTVTSYGWEDQGAGVIGITTNLNDPDIDITLTYQRAGVTTAPSNRRFRRMRAICRRFMADAMNSGLSAEEAFMAFEQRQQNGELPVSLPDFEFSYLLGHLGLPVETTPNARLSSQLWEYRNFCEVNGDCVTVISSEEEEGFAVAEMVPLRDGVVVRDLESYGFLRPMDLAELLTKEELIEEEPLPDLLEEEDYEADDDEVYASPPMLQLVTGNAGGPDGVFLEAVMFPWRYQKMRLSTAEVGRRRRRERQQTEILEVVRDLPEHGWMRAVYID